MNASAAEVGDRGRVILHLDMDAFYAAVEVLDDPSLCGKPVIVGGTPSGHGVVSTASYEARRFGVRSAMPAVTAVRLCPDGVFLSPRPKRYAELSRRVMAVLAEYSSVVEPISIDEAFLDITGSLRLAGAPREIAFEIKRRVHETTGGLTASVGIAPSKFVAKVASDLCKPDGLVVVEPGRVREFLAPLPIERIWGVGPKSAEVLHRAGCRRIRDLQERSEALLVASFGEEMGRHLHRLANGIDNRAVVTSGSPRSVSSETTLGEFVPPDDIEAVERLLLRLSEDVATRLLRGHARCRGITLKVRDEKFVTRTRSTSLEEPTCLTEEIYGAARRLFTERVDLGRRRIRLLGVAAGHLSFDELEQLDLFDSPDRDRALRVATTVDSIRARLGRGAIVRGRLLDGPGRSSDKRVPRGRT